MRHGSVTATGSNPRQVLVDQAQHAAREWDVAGLVTLGQRQDLAAVDNTNLTHDVQHSGVPVEVVRLHPGNSSPCRSPHPAPSTIAIW